MFKAQTKGKGEARGGNLSLLSKLFAIMFLFADEKLLNILSLTHETQNRKKRNLATHSGVNFINVLHANFSYESAFFAKILMQKPKCN